jgi:hypothetical protein
MCGLRCSHQISGVGVMIGQLVSVPCCVMLSATHVCVCVVVGVMMGALVSVTCCL